MAFDNEHDFSKYLTRKLDAAGMFYNRLESHATAKGIPDVYCTGLGDDFFIELKHVHQKMRDGLKVPYRPGQLAWHHEYMIGHTHPVQSLKSVQQKVSWVFIACDDGIIAMPMVPGNLHETVNKELSYFFTFKEFSALRIDIFLLVHSTYWLYQLGCTDFSSTWLETTLERYKELCGINIAIGMHDLLVYCNDWQHPYKMVQSLQAYMYTAIKQMLINN